MTKSYIKLRGLLLTVSLILASFCAEVMASTQDIACIDKGGSKKHIYIEYLDANTRACRTLYDAGGNRTKEIARANSNTHLCNEIAGRVVSRLTSAGWVCNNGGMLAADVKSQLRPAKLRKKIAHAAMSNTDYVDNEWLQKGILK
jgi:ribosomal protein L37AE/L43A